MSAKTKIVVLHMKKLILTGILIGLVILTALLLFILLSPYTNSNPKSVPTATYIPGKYTSTIQLNDTTFDVQVTVDSENINDVSLVNVNETVETMYPLVEPAMADLASQIIEKQSTSDISYSANNQYTSIVLMEAINNALDKAKRPGAYTPGLH